VSLVHDSERDTNGNRIRRLRERGIVLAVCSKNNATNVRWEEAVLGEDDFACTQINWDSKALNLNRIQNALNLKTKDFVFIDDRPDEWELVASAISDVFVMDATADRTWRQLDLWSRLLPSRDDLDRTKLYQERSRRQAFLDNLKSTAEDEGKALAQLGVRVHVRDVKEADVPRVVELINRTNQFNLCGSRTTPREAAAWLASGGPSRADRRGRR
jgi:FkbH-like protein